MVMIIIPLTFNAIQFWIQDSFLKGDDHVEERQKGQLEYRRRMTEMYNLRRSRISEPGASDFSESESDQYGAVVIRPNYKKRLTRQIDEGVFNLK